MGSGPINHGFSKTRLYGIWCQMKNRCYNTRVEKYPSYGGRGIRVCEEWRQNFLTFRRWALDNGYDSNLQIDRRDNDGNYEPSNCRWVSSKEQQRNRSNSSFITAFGETKLRKEWLADERCQVSQDTLRARLKRGWAPEQAITQPLNH